MFFKKIFRLKIPRLKIRVRVIVEFDFPVEKCSRPIVRYLYLQIRISLIFHCEEKHNIIATKSYAFLLFFQVQSAWFRRFNIKCPAHFYFVLVYCSFGIYFAVARRSEKNFRLSGQAALQASCTNSNTRTWEIILRSLSQGHNS